MRADIAAVPCLRFPVDTLRLTSWFGLSAVAKPVSALLPTMRGCHRPFGVVCRLSYEPAIFYPSVCRRVMNCRCPPNTNPGDVIRDAMVGVGDAGAAVGLGVGNRDHGGRDRSSSRRYWLRGSGCSNGKGDGCRACPRKPESVCWPELLSSSSSTRTPTSADVRARFSDLARIDLRGLIDG